MSSASGSSGWIAAVAKRAGVPNEDAAAVLGDWRIDPNGSLPAPRHLHLTHVRFRGTRPTEGTPNPGPFEFRWDGLGPGIWALASEINGAGKTSVLEIAMWALRGDPKNLAQDVRKWLEHVDVGFDLNGVEHRVAFEVDHGRPSGDLKRSGSNRQETTAFAFTTADEFEEHMSAFMMAELGLHPLRSWNSGTDTSVEHGWNALTGALYITRRQSSSLLGDVVVSGVAGRLLQVFLGVPWTQTVFNARSARDAANARRTRSQTKDVDPTRKQSLADLLTGLRQERKDLVSVTGSLARDTASAFAQMTAANRSYSDTHDEVRRRTSDVALAKAAVRELKHELMDRSETALAERFFQGLNPSLCPRCDTNIDGRRREREDTHHECAVCRTHVDSEPAPLAQADDGDDDGADVALSTAELRRRLDSAELAIGHAETALERALTDRESARMAADQARSDVEEAEAGQGSLVRLHELDVRIARAEGSIEEIDRVIEANEGTFREADTAYNILSAAHQEADERLRSARGDLFERLNRLATEIGRQLGIATLAGVEIDAAARVKVHKGGSTTNFGNCSPGEQLRLRIAVIVAMLRVGQDLGVGRHPGLLIVDSPAAEETNDNDAAMIMARLQQIAGLVPGLQVIAATARPSLLHGAVPDIQVRQVAGDERLW